MRRLFRRRHGDRRAAPRHDYYDQDEVWALELERQNEQRRMKAEAAEAQRIARVEEDRKRAAEQQRQAAEREEQARRAREAERELFRRQNAGSPNIAYLRELIRHRYTLDLWIWSHRDVGRRQKSNRPIIMQQCARADETLRQIYAIVEAWEEDLFSSPEEWSVARSIKTSLLRRDQHIVWCETPPWEIEDGDSVGRRRVVPQMSSVPPAELGS